jgi:hypothetical protein
MNPAEITSLLAVPRQLRTADVWDEKLIQTCKHENLPRAPPERRNGVQPGVSAQLDFVQIVNTNYGVEFVWKPAPPDPPPKNGWLIWSLLRGVGGGVQSRFPELSRERWLDP